MMHDLKIEEPYYHAVKEGRKAFEIRYNDRGYNAGDTIKMTPVDKCGTKLFHEAIFAEITYVTGYMQKENFVVFGFKIAQ